MGSFLILDKYIVRAAFFFFFAMQTIAGEVFFEKFTASFSLQRVIASSLSQLPVNSWMKLTFVLSCSCIASIWQRLHVSVL